MAITDSQKVDLLFKKVGYGVAKTDISTNKSPANEGNASPLVSPGTTIYQQDYSIPSATTLPTSNSSVVTVYRDSLTSTVQCTKLPTTSSNVSWSTGLTDWIPVQYGTGYQVKLYAGPGGSSTPQNYTNLPADGSGANDSWYFDYQSGIVNFADTSVPTAASAGGNVVYVVGARYTGLKGINNFGNLTIGNATITTTATVGNIVTTNGLFWANGVSALQSSYGNTQVATYLPNYGGNVSAANVTVSTGLFWANGVNYSTTLYGNTQTAAYLPLYTGNLSPGNVTSVFYGNVHTDYIVSKNNQAVSFAISSAIGLPTGGNTARPNSPVHGQFRYNTDIDTIEFYNGAGWVNLSSSVSSQYFYGDGSNNIFTLNTATTAAGILVSINGTVQLAGVAYTVSGDQITFTEVPLDTDLVDIRFLAAATTNNFNDMIVNDTAIVVTTANTIVDSFDATLYRSAKYIVSGTTHMSEIQILQNSDVVLLNTYGVLNTDSNTINYYANINGSTVNLLANGTVSSNIRIQRTYFAI